jgi:hypothetical protein
MAALGTVVESDAPKPQPVLAQERGRARAPEPLDGASHDTPSPGDMLVELSELTQKLAEHGRFDGGLIKDGPRAIPPSREPASSWLTPRAAQSAIRAFAVPYFDGAASYPRGTRVIARGNVRADTGRNLITNGDFSRGDLMWSVRSWRGFGDTSVAAYYSVQAGALCTSLEPAQQVAGGWPWDDRRLSPSSFDLVRGKRYRLSLRAWSSGPELVQLVVKVGHQKPPYTPAMVAKVPMTAEPGLFDIDFVAVRDDTSAGFAFVAAGPSEGPLSEFCIDDVTVRPLDGEP